MTLLVCMSQLTQEERVSAIVTMNQPMELQPNLFGTPVTPRASSSPHQSLRERDIDALYVCVCFPGAEDWANAGVEQCLGSTTDFAPPSLQTIERYVPLRIAINCDLHQSSHARVSSCCRCVSFIHRHVQGGRVVYIHCKAGRGRSTVVLVAYLAQHRQTSVADAYALVKSRRPHVSLHPKQKRILREFEVHLTEASSFFGDE